MLFVLIAYLLIPREISGEIYNITRLPFTGMPPFPRSDHSAVFSSKYNSLFVFGGRDMTHYKIFNDMWVFNLTTLQWSFLFTLTDIQPSIRHSAAIYISKAKPDYIYVFGGSGQNGPLIDLWEYDIILRTWSFIKSWNSFFPIMLFGYTYYERDSVEYLALYGGIDIGKYSNKLFIFKIDDLEWEEIQANGDFKTVGAELPNIKYFSNYLYVLGGYGMTPPEFYRYSFEQNKWENVTNESYKILPQEFNTVIDGNYLYSIFGYNDDSYINSIKRVDLTTGDFQWEKIKESYDHYRTGFSLTEVNSKYYIFGGTYNFIANDFKILELSANKPSLTEITPNYEYPEPRSNHIFKKINTKFYVFGGTSISGYLKDLWAFDSLTEKWAQMSHKGDIPSARQLSASDSFGDSLLVWGGEESSGLLNDVFIYNSQTNIWAEIISKSYVIPTARKGACLVNDMPYIYIYGGETNNGFSSELWKFDMGTQEYSLISHSPYPIAYANCQIFNDSFNVLFGCKETYDNIFGYWSFSFTAKRWMFTDSKSQLSGGAQGISLMIGDMLIYYGGRYMQYSTYKYINCDFEDTTINVKTDLHNYNSAFIYHKSQLYFFGGSKVSIYLTMIPSYREPTLGNIELKDAFKQVKNSILCSPGTFLNGNQCEECPKGTYSENFSNEECIKCKPGTYNSNIGATKSRQCYPCPKGYFNELYGASTCIQCSSNDYCPAGSKSLEIKRQRNKFITYQPSNYDDKFDSSILFKFQIISGLMVFLILIIWAISAYRKKIAEMDDFVDNHNYELNTPIMRKKTLFGGVFTLLFYGSAFILIGSAGIEYFWNNIYELKTLQPLVVLEKEVDHFYTDLTIVVELFRYSDSCSSDNEVCSESIYITYDNIKYSGNSKNVITCEKTSDDTCIIVFSCSDCWIDPGANFRIEMKEDMSYCSGIFVNITSKSSIPESDSSIITGLFSDDEKIFIGPDATKFFFILTPSLFRSSLRRFPSKITGYHISMESAIESGSQYYGKDISISTELMVIIYLSQATSAMYTVRDINQSLFVIFTGLLGSVSGAMEAAVFFMRFIEENYISIKNKFKMKEKLKKYLKKRLKLGMNINESQENTNILSRSIVIETSSNKTADQNLKQHSYREREALSNEFINHKIKKGAKVSPSEAK
ncbi:hypothetical protein SteCoe_15196 [Stentor coeruleus]|uniref:Tyrosine-protein kinase ephrin type A/B receptor-like domain-containing protein n=1 Tax=Stentor coeruleus TaxID=5963 RepID=A0A1R2C430_9CILI|nr:hypothetical protein SteCoe_15196 [Stentor coeruleus]